ncbi:MAG: hypothetical protein OSB57_11410 [Planctomycetota bacterium]|nr:hypothetical protein [Planctomycetota bacterium]
MSKKQSTGEIATTTPSDFPLFASEKGARIMSTLKEMDIKKFDLDKIKAPSGGAVAFEVEGLDGIEYKQELEVVIGLMIGGQRAWHRVNYEDSDGGAAPDCVSTDGKTGFGSRDKDGDEDSEKTAMDCDDCPWNQWESHRSGGAGRDCGEKAILYAFTKTSLIPIVIQVSATSLKPLKRHAMKLMGFGLELHDVVTSITLEKRAGRVEYSQMVFKRVESLPAEHQATMLNVTNELANAFAGQ